MRSLSALPLTLLALFAAFSNSSTASAPAEDCVSPPDGQDAAETINALFKHGGPGKVVSLCPSTIFRLQQPVIMTAADQEVSTAGYPEDEARAMLVVEGQEQSVAVRGDCDDCARVRIRNIIVNGNRPALHRVEDGLALIELGNQEGHVIEGCRLYEPRGWSSLHIREGDHFGVEGRISCSNATVRANHIGPAGEEWDDEYDGDEPEHPVHGNPRADGISLACERSLIEDNLVYDTTDGAIVIFGSPGTLVRRNRVFSRASVMLGGINLVDYAPYAGNYTGTVVEDNVIDAASGFLKMALGVGTAGWGDDIDSVVYGGTVRRNTLKGDKMGYGLVVAGAKNFTVVDNVSTARHSGWPTYRCPTGPENAPPQAFLINKFSSEGEFQQEFVNGEVQAVICICEEGNCKNESPPASWTWPPWGDMPKGQEPAGEAEDGGLAENHEDDDHSGSHAVLAEIVFHSQTRLIEAIEALEQRVSFAAGHKAEALTRVRGAAGPDKHPALPQTPGQRAKSAVLLIKKRIEASAAEVGQLVKTTESLAFEIKSLEQQLAKHKARSSDILTELTAAVQAQNESSWFAPSAFWLLTCQAVIIAALLAFRRLERRRGKSRKFF